MDKLPSSEIIPQMNRVIKILPLQYSPKDNQKIYNNKIVLQKPNSYPLKNRLLPLTPKVALGLEKELSKSDFETLQDKCVGSGSFGSVWKVRHKETNQIYAIKVINKEYIIKQNQERNRDNV